MNYEQKYNEALERAKEFYNDKDNIRYANAEGMLEDIFPELKEPEDEKIREYLIRYIDNTMKSSELKSKLLAWLEKQDEQKVSVVDFKAEDWYVSKVDGKIYNAKFMEQNSCKKTTRREEIEKAAFSTSVIIEQTDWFIKGAEWADEHPCCNWLEKQGENCLVNFDEAEKEKYDFVSGQYIECRASFNEFKEDNSYWLEYVGDDNYIGRSDNILNQKFHITPRQLFTLFTQQHCPKDNNVNEETNAPTGYGKYVDECLNEATKHFFSEGEDKYSVADLFYAGVRCGKSWFEKQTEQKSSTQFKPKFKVGDKVIGIVSDMQYYITDVCYDHYYTESGCIIMFCSQDNFKLVEQKPARSEDESIISDLLDYFDEDKCLKHEVNDIVKWLKTIKPQQKGWGENEIKMLDNLITYLDGRKDLLEKIKRTYIDWLKSLKQRIGGKQ